MPDDNSYIRLCVFSDGPIRKCDAEFSLSTRSENQTWSRRKSGSYENTAAARKSNAASLNSGAAASSVDQEWRWSTSHFVDASRCRDNSESVLITSISRSCEMTLVLYKSYLYLKR